MQVDKKKIVKIEEDENKALSLAAELFYSGKIFIYPTDTIYGIGGNPFDQRSVTRIAKVKGRDESKKFIWLFSDFEKVLNFTEIEFDEHIDFLENLWPAPVTVILKLNSRTRDIINQKTIAIRIPDNDFCLKLLREISRPLVSTSVNRSGEEPLINIEKIIDDYSKQVDAVFHNSKNSDNISSTIIDLTSEKPLLVREGSVKFVELLKKFD
jgi:L-threonylcarbamoyladenylate synthase